jgi:hypothetical protein
MEAIGAVASIGGIIQLPLNGIAAIKFLQRLYEDCSDEVAQDFMHGLITSAQMHHDVQALCSRIQHHNNYMISQIRTASLQIQLEDCIHDLENWRTIANRINITDQKRSSSKILTGVGGATKVKLTSAEKFRRFVQAAFKASAVTAIAEARYAVQYRFQQHQAGMGTALAILQAYVLPLAMNVGTNSGAQRFPLCPY